MFEQISLAPRGRIEAADRVEIRPPDDGDGLAVHRLIGRCAPLDENSLYCNLLQCLHFAETCAVAERGGQLAGFLSAYIVPATPWRLFVWQIAVAPQARGQGLGRKMLQAVLARPACAGVRELHATVTADNVASARLFASLARHLRAPIGRRILFDRFDHFDGEHASEILIEIGPFVVSTPQRRPSVAVGSRSRTPHRPERAIRHNT